MTRPNQSSDQNGRVCRQVPTWNMAIWLSECARVDDAPKSIFSISMDAYVGRFQLGAWAFGCLSSLALLYVCSGSRLPLRLNIPRRLPVTACAVAALTGSSSLLLPNNAANRIDVLPVDAGCLSYPKGTPHAGSLSSKFSDKFGFPGDRHGMERLQ
jgi:hypothetical protein